MHATICCRRRRRVDNKRLPARKQSVGRKLVCVGFFAAFSLGGGGGRGLVLCPPRYKSSLDAINSLRRANIRVALEFFTAYLFAVEK